MPSVFIQGNCALICLGVSNSTLAPQSLEKDQNINFNISAHLYSTSNLFPKLLLAIGWRRQHIWELGQDIILVFKHGFSN